MGTIKGSIGTKYKIKLKPYLNPDRLAEDSLSRLAVRYLAETPWRMSLYEYIVNAAYYQTGTHDSELSTILNASLSVHQLGYGNIHTI